MADFDLEGTDCRNEQHFHVLAVDDNQIDRKLLEKLLTVSSYQVTVVNSGDKALEFLGLLDDIEDNRSQESSSSNSSDHKDKVSRINLIMTDYSMPGINGYDLLKRVKDSSWKDVPVVVMSSENLPSRINMCLEGGAEEFLLKPVKLSDLKKIHSHLLNSSINNNNNNNNNSNCDEKQDRDVTNYSNSSNKRKPIISTISLEIMPRVKELMPVN